MPVISSEIKYYLSGGSGNTDPDAALGGIRSTTEIVTATEENLFDNISSGEATSGDTEYRCFYVKNTNGTDSLASTVVWIDVQTSSADTSIEIGLDPAGNGDGSSTGVATTVANESTAPAGVSFTAPSTALTGLSIGTLTAGQCRAVWVKRICNAGAALTASDTSTIKVRGLA